MRGRPCFRLDESLAHRPRTPDPCVVRPLDKVRGSRLYPETSMGLRFLIVLAIGTLALSPRASTAQTPALNRQVLERYLTQQTISRLDWQLMQFNMSWHDAYPGPGEYLRSFPAWFDSAAMQFKAQFRVKDQRSFDDQEGFFSLPRWRQEAILQNGANDFVELLARFFPEVNTNSALVALDFVATPTAGTPTVVAEFRNGKITLRQ
jgi:hypothetical protein